VQALPAGADALVHRSVALQGRWLAPHTVYLDNRQMHGRPGFFVLTPLALDTPTPAVVLVQRGWIPRNFQDRTALAPVRTPQGLVAVTGRLAPPPARLYEMAPGADPVLETSPIRQNLDMTRYGVQTGLSLPALSVVQTGAGSEGLERDWPRIDAGVDKHYGYAFQWFGISVLMAVLYVWFQLFRRFIRPRQQPAA
jgi:surfeit locus 1 family protein